MNNLSVRSTSHVNLVFSPRVVKGRLKSPPQTHGGHTTPSSSPTVAKTEQSGLRVFLNETDEDFRQKYAEGGKILQWVFSAESKETIQERQASVSGIIREDNKQITLEAFWQGFFVSIGVQDGPLGLGIDPFGRFARIQVVRLEGLPELKAVPEGIGALVNLQTLTLMECPQLETISESIGKLSKLQNLFIHHCPKLIFLPLALGRCRMLSSFCGFNGVPVNTAKGEISLSRQFHNSRGIKEEAFDEWVIKIAEQQRRKKLDLRWEGPVNLAEIIEKKVIENVYFQENLVELHLPSNLWEPFLAMENIGKLKNVKKLSFSSI